VQQGQTGRIRLTAARHDDHSSGCTGIILHVHPSRPTPPLPQPQAVLFDMDGVLVDSEPLWFEAERAVMARLHGSWGEGDQHALVGGSMAVTVAYLLAKGTRPVDPAVVEGWLTGFMTDMLGARPLPVMPGARELVREVAAAGLPYGLVTSSERVIMDAVLAGFGISFPVTVCADDVSACKPDPEGYLLAAAKLAVNPARCVVIEDSRNGVAAAEAAGCLAVAVPSVVPIPAAPGRVVVSSLAGLSLARLQAEYARLRG
jgi:HAD superfamily hydrolase (TIGR01509 family)